MKLIVGLGNPEKKYFKTRHNVGWLVLDDLKKKLNFPEWQEKKKFQALIAEGENFILAKPLTYMNESGRAARLIANYYKIKPADLWVVHDDLDIILGKLKRKTGGGSAGHKGVQSIIDYLKTQDFNRLRIGIQPLGGPTSSAGRQTKPAKDLVLKKFGLWEKSKIKNGLKSAVEILAEVIQKN